MSDNSLRKLLFLVLQLKNNPQLDVDWTVIELQNKDIEATFKYLEELAYIREFQVNDGESLSRIPYKVELTQKGIDFITNNKEKSDFDWTTFLIRVIPEVLKIGSVILKSQVL